MWWGGDSRWVGWLGGSEGWRGGLQAVGLSGSVSLDSIDWSSTKLVSVQIGSAMFGQGFNRTPGLVPVWPGGRSGWTPPSDAMATPTPTLLVHACVCAWWWWWWGVARVTRGVTLNA